MAAGSPDSGGRPGPRNKRRAGPTNDVSATLFVGDLPPYVTSSDLQTVFGDLWASCKARVMGSQCYGFIEFDRPEEAQQVLEQVKDEPIKVDGHSLRVNWAQGAMPDWKRGQAMYRSRSSGQGPEGLESYEHPRARELRLKAQAMVHHMGAQPAFVVMPANQPRYVLSYDDL